MIPVGRGAPNKPGLTYFPKVIDFYEDDKIFDLLDRHGPLGVTVYECILCIVYRNGYYAEIPLDKLSRMIMKMIGNKWVKSQKAVVQVVHFCSEIGLLDDDLMTKNIITSVGIQRRYYEIAVKRMKRQLYSDKYWLLEKEEKEEPVLNVSKNRISSEENRFTSEEIRITSEVNAPEIKENKKKKYNTAFQPPELEEAFQMYLLVRNHNYGDILPEQVRALREELAELSQDPDERLAIVKQATAGGLKSFCRANKPLKTERGKKKGFDNFKGRKRDMKELEKRLLEEG